MNRANGGEGAKGGGSPVGKIWARCARCAMLIGKAISHRTHEKRIDHSLFRAKTIGNVLRGRRLFDYTQYSQGPKVYGFGWEYESVKSTLGNL